MPHYDLTESMRSRAIGAGAVEVGGREQARLRRARRAGKLHQQHEGVAVHIEQNLADELKKAKA